MMFLRHAIDARQTAGSNGPRPYWLALLAGPIFSTKARLRLRPAASDRDEQGVTPDGLRLETPAGERALHLSLV